MKLGEGAYILKAPSGVAPRQKLVIATREGAIAASSAEPSWAIISVRDPGDPYPTFSRLRTGALLHLCFSDIAENSRKDGAVPPQRSHIDTLISFFQRLYRERPEGIIIHCTHGISRSSAIAVGLIAAMGSLDQVSTGIEHALALSESRGWRFLGSNILPNTRIVGLFDQALGLDGKLIRLVLSHYHARYNTGAFDIERRYGQVVQDLREKG